MDSQQEREVRSNIQLEQSKLLQTETILKQLLTKINENLNALTVEEMQLKANSVIADIKPQMENSYAEYFKSKPQENILPDKPEEINKQSLFLNVSCQPMMDEEECDSS